jgi:hypothetical protein
VRYHGGGAARPCGPEVEGKLSSSAVAFPHSATAIGATQLGLGEMWNSNSVISWLLARSGLETESIEAPAGGRAPGWDAGLVLARRQNDVRPEPSRLGRG